jgi:hypothetical protein
MAFAVETWCVMRSLIQGETMPKFSFENIHKNKKLAFADGLLCGLCVAWIVRIFYKEDD